MVKTIMLGSKPTLPPGVIILGRRKTFKQKRKAKAQRKKDIRRRAKKRRAKLSLPLRILTSPKTTLALLGTLIAPLRVGRFALGAAKFAAPKTLKGVLVAGVTLPTGILVLTQSERAFETLKFAIDPRKAPERAKIIAGIIEDPSKLLPTDKITLKERVLEVGKAAGILGAGVALVAGGISIAKKKLRGAKIPKVSLPTRQIAPQVLPAALLPAAPSLTPDTQPLGAVKQVEEKPTPTLPVEKIKPMKITNTFNPTIDIRFSKSRKFINQQILIR